MNRVPVGPSTLALLTAAVGAAAVFVGEWAAGGDAPAWAALTSAALVAVLGVLRSWQAVNLPTAAEPLLVDVVDEGMASPDDVPADQVPDIG